MQVPFYFFESSKETIMVNFAQRHGWIGLKALSILLAGLCGLLPGQVAAQFAYVTSISTDDVSVIDVNTNTVVGTPIPVGFAPIAIAVIPDGTRAYVSNYNADSVSVIDLTTNTVVGSPIPVGDGPFGIAITPDGTRAYVTNDFSNNVYAIDLSNNTVVGPPIPVGSRPQGIAITPDGTRAYVTNAANNSVSVIDITTNTIVGIPITVSLGPSELAVTPDGSWVYVANGGTSAQVSLIDVATNMWVSPHIQVDTVGLVRPTGIAITPDGASVFVTGRSTNNVAVIDVATNAVVGSSIPVGTTPVSIRITPDGASAYVTCRDSNEVVVINVATRSVLTSIPFGSRSPFGIAITPGLSNFFVDIDIKPGSNPNSINLCSNGALPIAILGADSFNVNDVNSDTLRFAEASVKVVGKKAPHSLCTYEDVNSDGITDLVCHFVTTDIAGIDGQSTTATLNGELNDGTEFEGTDAVNIVKDTCN